MRKMLTMRRRQGQGRVAGVARAALSGLAAYGFLTVVVVMTAAAQGTTPPPAAASPALEAGDTAPPGAAPAPVEPLVPAAGTSPAAPQAVAPTMALAESGPAPVPPARRTVPIYKEHWFWGVVTVVVITGIVVIGLTLRNADPATPATKLGDMRAF
jgi:hypothetical protein